MYSLARQCSPLPHMYWGVWVPFALFACAGGAYTAVMLHTVLVRHAAQDDKDAWA
jgi:hypothetical protein